ncbi:hypothetical protein [Actinoplanes siamensis]|uniref:Uncharacterized protein n=1 Tax=Actinoplanes siamensis TaxID=1223317 RepID=A0A919NBU9_9ACTN|nr:hypothetical protein [Actinoplanes siamensis]GIF08314.1 hypothetical protein Asi03nite_58520 [Actinoplanes siamensis]
MTEQVDRFTLTTGPDGRGLLTLALRRHPTADADGFARAQRYWACAPAGAQPRWLALAAGPAASGPHRPCEHAEDGQEAADAHAAAAVYLPGVACSWCGDRWWKPANREVVTRYVLTGLTGGCLTCGHQPSSPEAAAAPRSAPPKSAPPKSAPPKSAPPKAPSRADFGPPQTVDARILPSVTVRLDGEAAAMLWTATGGNDLMMSILLGDLVIRRFGTGFERMA